MRPHLDEGGDVSATFILYKPTSWEILPYYKLNAAFRMMECDDT